MNIRTIPSSLLVPQLSAQFGIDSREAFRSLHGVCDFGTHNWLFVPSA
jgi:hypothetical protein